MECFAAYLSYTDAQIGRLLEFLAQTGDLDNTVIVAVSDNGASAEGGPRGSINDARLMNGDPAGRRELRARIDEIGGPTAHNNYPWGWTMAGNTPFKRWKREVHEGGVADPCIVAGPGVADAGSSRFQFAHAVDVLPTVLDLAGIELPAEIDGVTQSRVDGVSFAPVLRDANNPPTRTTQYFEMLGSRGIYHDGWKAVTFHALGRDVRRRARPRRTVRRRRVGAVPRGRMIRRRRTTLPRSSRNAWPRCSTCGGNKRARQRRAAARQPPAVRNPEPAADDPSGTRVVRVLPGYFAGARDGRGQRAQPVAHDHRRGRGARGRRAERHAARDGLGARRLHAATRRGSLAVRAQSLRDDARHRDE